MHKKNASVIMLTVLLTSILSLAFTARPANAVEPIYIRVNGNIEPADSPISTSDYVTYNFTGNISQPIVVQASGIVLDGGWSTQGFTLQVNVADSTGIKLDSGGVNNVTVRNTCITQGRYGIFLNSSSGNTLSENYFVAKSYAINYGIYLYSSSGNTLSENKFMSSRFGIWLDSSPSNTLEHNNATGNVKDGIHLLSSSNNTLRENSATGSLNQSGIFLEYSDNNTLSGNSATGNYECGLHLRSSVNNTLSDNNMIENRKDGICLESSNNNILSGNTATENYDGLNIQSSSHNTLVNNTATKNSLNGLHLQNYSSNNTLLKNNAIGNPYGDGICIDFSSDNKLSNNTATENGECGLRLQNSVNNTSLENNLEGNTLDGICLSSSYNNTLSGNTATENDGCGIRILNSLRNIISNNTIATNTGAGVDFQESSVNTIDANNITKNGSNGVNVDTSSENNRIYANNIARQNGAAKGDATIGVGIYIRSAGNTVDGNNITANSYGVYLQSCSNNMVHGNNITANEVYGVWLSNVCADNVICENNITNNSNFGVFVLNSHYNTICTNNLLDNSYGVAVWSSEHNKFYHNSFSSPAANILNAQINTWDNGYPSGGNHWSEYSGPDNNTDGIGDESFIIDSSCPSEDRYPLMSDHYVAINSVWSKTVVAQMYSVNISATVSNYGSYGETINVTLFAGSTFINQTIVSLPTAQSSTITLTCSLPDLELCRNYTLNACASSVSGEPNFVGRNCNGTRVVVTIVGDITGDCVCDMHDIGPLAAAREATWNATDGLYWHSLTMNCKTCPHNPNCDINNDGKVDMKDIGSAAKNFGKPKT